MTIAPTPVGPVVERLRRVPGFEDASIDGPGVRFTAGFWADTSRLDLRVGGRRRSVVVRRAPDRDLAAKEAAVQAGVSVAGFSAPTVHLFDPNGTEGDSRPLLVMDTASGAPLLSGLDGLAAFARLPRLAARLPRLLAEAMTTLHGLDPAPIGAALERSGTRATLTVDAWLAGLADAAGTAGRVDLAAAIERLAASRPAPAQPVLCHGDLHPFNLLVDGDRWTLLDWTAAALAEPAYDLAFTRMLLAHPPLHLPGPLGPIGTVAGRSLAAAFVRAYGRRNASVDPERLTWFEALHATRVLLEVDGWARAGTTTEHAGHPFLLLSPHAATVLSALTGVLVPPPG